MSIDDRILNALRYGPRRKKYIVVLLLLAIPAVTLLAFPLIAAFLFWRFYARAKIYADYYRDDPSYEPAAQAIAAFEQFSQREGCNPIQIKYVKRFYGIRSPKPFLVLFDKPNVLIITPARYWSRYDDSYSSGESSSLAIRPTEYGMETLDPEPTDEVLSSRWMKSTKSGERDYRYKDNTEIFKVQRFGVTVILQNGTQWRLAGLTDSHGCLKLANSFCKISGSRISIQEAGATDYADAEAEQEDDVDDLGEGGDVNGASSKQWHEVLGVSPDASHQLIKEARDRLVRGLHPDKLKGVEGLSPEIEQYANARLVEVNLAYEQAKRSRGQ